MKPLVLIVVPDSDKVDEKSALVEQRVRTAGFRASSAASAAVVEQIKALATRAESPSVVLIGPAVPNSLSLARRVRNVWPTGQILFVPDALQAIKLRQDLRMTPRIGPNWSVVDMDDSTFPQRVQEAAYSTRQRLRLRTTLDRVNVQLSAPKAIDSVDYRRTVVSEHYLANLLAQSQDAILSLDAQDRVLYWSAGAERLFKRNTSDAQGTPARTLPFWSAQLDASLARIRNGEPLVTCETRCSMPNGDIDFDISLSGVRDRNGHFIGTSLALHDVSARNHALEDERTARREAERISRMKDEFLAMLSHELRTPLSAVIGRTQLLKMRHRDDPELLSALSVIERNAQLQAKLIEDLLDVSAVITGKLHLDMQPVAVGDLLQSALESIKPEAEAKQIILSQAIQPGVGSVRGDQHRLQQVLFNLLANAVKFTPQRGRIEVAAARKGPRIEMTVSDTGIGIDPGFLSSVFERFGQEDASITRRHGGLGLGLSIAKQLVGLHGGDIHAFSEGRNRGAVFTVSLPFAAAITQAAPAAQLAVDAEEIDTSALRGSYILVVDDIPDARRLAAEVLRSHGAEVTEVDSGRAALQALAQRRPDVIVSDIGMPDMDGYELLRHVRAQGCTAEMLPAIALTAYANKSDRERVLQAGFQMHAVKPLIVSDLLISVVRLLAARKS